MELVSFDIQPAVQGLSAKEDDLPFLACSYLFHTVAVFEQHC